MKLSDRKAKLDQSVVALKDGFPDFLNFTHAIDGVTKTAKRERVTLHANALFACSVKG